MERVEAEIVELASQITAASARLITLIGEFDAAEGWRDWGMKSTAHWLSWQTGVDLHTGREQVRVARALRELPATAAAFEGGKLSYSKVRALTRFVTPDTDVELADTAQHATGSQIERLGAQVRRARRGADVQARRKAAYVNWHQDTDGSIVGTFRLAPEQAAVFCHGLDAAAGRLAELAGDGDAAAQTGAGLARSAADALVAMAEAFLKDVPAGTSSERAERYQLVLHTSAEELAKPDDAEDTGPGTILAGGNGRQWRIAPSTARRLTCDCPTSTMIDGPDGAALHLGRKTRRIRGRLRRAVMHRDQGMCQTPGCTEAATQIHHLHHWVHGGPTCLRNLVSLCDSHHWLLHEGGFTLAPRGGGFVLIGPEGVKVGPHPQPHEPVGSLPVNPDVAPDAVTGHWDGSRLHADDLIRYITGVEAFGQSVQRPEIEDEDASAESWQPIDWPVTDYYPGEPWDDDLDHLFFRG
jgi:hypothetical protein